MNRNINLIKVLIVLMSIVVISDIHADTIGLRVLEEDGHPQDTLYVGYPGYVTIILNLDNADSVQAVVLTHTFGGSFGSANLISEVSSTDWEWLGPYSLFEANGFNDSYQDGISPDSGVMFSTLIQAVPATQSDSLVARVLVTPLTDGVLQFDTVTISDGIVENVTAVVLTAAGYQTVEDVLAFDFRSVTITTCPDVAISCLPSPVDTFLCDAMQVCLDVPIVNAFTVNVDGAAVWADDELCFLADTSGTYTFTLIAENQCGADTCDITVNVLIDVAPTIDCPTETFYFDIVGPMELKVELVIENVDSVHVLGGAFWFADTLRFWADLSQVYTFTSIAYSHCWADTCNVVIDATVGCCLIRGDVDGENSSGVPISISDLTYLVAYLFSQGPQPPCMEEGNVDGLDNAGTPINIVDLTYLVAYLFSEGPEPPPCNM